MSDEPLLRKHLIKEYDETCHTGCDVWCNLYGFYGRHDTEDVTIVDCIPCLWKAMKFGKECADRLQQIQLG